MTPQAGARPRKRLLVGLLAAAAALLALAALAFAFRARILTGLADYLIVDDRLQPADMLFVLNGDYNTRPFKAAQLYQQGLAPVIVMARSQSLPAEKLGLLQNETDVAVAVMEKLGVPADQIEVLQVPGGVTSTFDEAAVLRQYIRDHSIRSFILVTSAFHTRRARWIISKELAGLPVNMQVSAVPYSGFDQTDWWRNEDGLIALNNEYVKLLYYYWKYR